MLQLSVTEERYAQVDGSNTHRIASGTVHENEIIQRRLSDWEGLQAISHVRQDCRHKQASNMYVIVENRGGGGEVKLSVVERQGRVVVVARVERHLAIGTRARWGAHASCAAQVSLLSD